MKKISSDAQSNIDIEKMARVAAAIWFLRVKAGLSQEELAARAKISQPHLSLIEKCKVEPMGRTLMNIIQALGIEDVEFWARVKDIASVDDTAKAVQNRIARLEKTMS